MARSRPAPAPAGAAAMLTTMTTTTMTTTPRRARPARPCGGTRRCAARPPRPSYGRPSRCLCAVTQAPVHRAGRRRTEACVLSTRREVHLKKVEGAGGVLCIVFRINRHRNCVKVSARGPRPLRRSRSPPPRRAVAYVRASSTLNLNLQLTGRRRARARAGAAGGRGAADGLAAAPGGVQGQAQADRQARGGHPVAAHLLPDQGAAPRPRGAPAHNKGQGPGRCCVTFLRARTLLRGAEQALLHGSTSGKSVGLTQPLRSWSAGVPTAAAQARSAPRSMRRRVRRAGASKRCRRLLARRRRQQCACRWGGGPERAGRQQRGGAGVDYISAACCCLLPPCWRAHIHMRRII